MAKLTPSELAAKWAKNFGASGEDYKRGINSVTQSPAQKAIAQKELMQTNWLESVNSGRWERKLGAVTIGAWKQKAIDKGAPALPAAARAAQINVETAERRIGPFRDALIASLPPRGDLNANIARMTEFARRMAELKTGAFGGGEF